MNNQDNTSLSTAEFLLQIKAIKLDPNHPFTWTSGIKSPIYCDNRKILSYPRIRTYVRQEFAKIINDEFSSVDVIAGVATGAIAHGVLVAQELGLPFVYVRAESKKHGLENKIEGVVETGQSVVVIEDLVSTGKSSLEAVDALRKAGCVVKGMIAIFSYLLPSAIENFKKANVKLITLTDYNVLIKKALMNKYISDADLQSLMDWKENPSEWGK
ncbi:MAG: orotate phosphoribosyltransferase [Bacteroidetes bacterium]|nr:orotate phosphoribosyltransferase [Bacteroidota bacterium]